MNAAERRERKVEREKNRTGSCSWKSRKNLRSFVNYADDVMESELNFGSNLKLELLPLKIYAKDA